MRGLRGLRFFRRGMRKKEALKKETAPPGSPQAERFLIVAAAATHPGLRRKRNEDAILERAEIGLFAVADGVGGGERGEHASALLVEALGRLPPPAGYDGFAADVRAAIERVNRALRQERAAFFGGRLIASTIAVLLFHDPFFCCLWAGDSRIYRLKGGRLERLTRDHSEVERLLEKGLITLEEVRGHPLAHIITRAVGADEVLRLDAVEGRIEKGDAFLLCSDGLTHVVSEEAIESALRRFGPSEAVRALIDLTLAKGAPDNVSVVAVKLARPCGKEKGAARAAPSP